jgi:tRNA A37 threonylcarbamoyladenosine dehydratase
MVRDISKTQQLLPGKQVRKGLKRKSTKDSDVFSNEIQKEESLKMTDGSNFKNLLRNDQLYIPIFGLYAAAEVINYL